MPTLGMRVLTPLCAILKAGRWPGAGGPLQRGAEEAETTGDSLGDGLPQLPCLPLHPLSLALFALAEHFVMR